MGLAEADTEVWAPIITVAGFSRRLQHRKSNPVINPSPDTPDEWRTRLQGSIESFTAVQNCSNPVISVPNVNALDRACEFVQVCDTVVASDLRSGLDSGRCC